MFSSVRVCVLKRLVTPAKSFMLKPGENADGHMSFSAADSSALSLVLWWKGQTDFSLINLLAASLETAASLKCRCACL